MGTDVVVNEDCKRDLVIKTRGTQRHRPGRKRQRVDLYEVMYELEATVEIRSSLSTCYQHSSHIPNRCRWIIFTIHILRQFNPFSQFLTETQMPCKSPPLNLEFLLFQDILFLLMYTLACRIRMNWNILLINSDKYLSDRSQEVRKRSFQKQKRTNIRGFIKVLHRFMLIFHDILLHQAVF